MIKAFRALKYRNFKLFFPGLVISQTGIWMQSVAVAWLVYDITKSPFAMGSIMCFNAVPLLFITPFGGVIVDKFDRHKLLFAIQILFALQAFLMTLISYGGFIHIWNIILLSLFLNIIASIDAPLRQSTFICLVDDVHDLGNAISLNSCCFNLARLVGPALAGLIIARIDVRACFLINFLCLMPSVFLVKMMKINDIKSEEIKNATIIEGLKEGVRYIATHQQIKLLLQFVAVFSFVVLTYSVLIPMYSKDVLNSDADVLGLLMSMTGVGALLASLFLASQTSTKGLRKFLLCGTLLIGISFVGIGMIHSVAFSAFFMFCAGFGMPTFFVSNNMLIQSIVDDDKRGRVMSINALCFMGTTSVSSFIAGSIADFFGIAQTFTILGCILFLMAVYFGLKLHSINFSEKKTLC